MSPVAERDLRYHWNGRSCSSNRIADDKTQNHVRILLGSDQKENTTYHSLDYAMDKLKIPIV